MSEFRVQRAAGYRLEEIYACSRDNWGDERAERYIARLFQRFAAIAAREFPWRTIPAEVGISGFVCRYEQHLIYWKILADGAVAIVTILHERMHQIERLREELG